MARTGGKKEGAETDAVEAAQPRPTTAKKARKKQPAKIETLARQPEQTVSRKGRRKQPGAAEEVVRTEPERAPLPDPTGLAHTLSPVDLPDPPEPLLHGLRWASITISVATIVLALLNAHAIRGWSYQLPPNAWSAQIVTAAESWYDALDRLGMNRPVEAMHDGWQSLKDRRFGGEPPPAETAQR
jgi:hypothetical protein